MRILPIILAVLIAAAGCAEQGAARRTFPAGSKKVALRTPANQTQQFGMEDVFMRNIRDEFLKDGSVAIAPEAEADGIVAPAITRYLVTPVQYDTTLNPTAYKLDIDIDLKFLKRSDNSVIWEEKDMEVFEIYPADNLPGGKNETAAQADLWDELARDIVTRVVKGFSGRS